MTVPHSYSKKEREYLGRIEARVEILRARLATTNLPDPQEITKELHSLEWVLQQCSRGPVDDGGITQALVAMARANAIEECAQVCDAEWQTSSSLTISKCAGELAKRIRAIDSPFATPQHTKEDV
jgi:hypothetical protein